jgi:hypothetical protein
MCVLAIVKDKPISDLDIEKIWSQNSCGSGVAFYQRGKISYIKGIMKLKELKTLLPGIPAPYVVHFRIGTAGDNSPALTHPFIVDNDLANNPLTFDEQKRPVELLFHNGHYSGYLDSFVSLCIARKVKFPEYSVSDTYCIAKLAGSLGTGYLKLISGLSNKFVTMNNKGIFCYPSEKDFTDIDNVLYSNTYWRYTYSGAIALDTTKPNWWDEYKEYYKGGEL